MYNPVQGFIHDQMFPKITCRRSNRTHHTVQMNKGSGLASGSFEPNCPAYTRKPSTAVEPTLVTVLIRGHGTLMLALMLKKFSTDRWGRKPSSITVIATVVMPIAMYASVGIIRTKACFDEWANAVAGKNMPKSAAITASVGGLRPVLLRSKFRRRYYAWHRQPRGYCLVRRPVPVRRPAVPGVKSDNLGAAAQPKIHRMISGGSNAVTGGMAPTNFSTSTKQVWAIGPCARLEVPLSIVSKFGFPCLHILPGFPGSTGSNQAPVLI